MDYFNISEDEYDSLEDITIGNSNVMSYIHGDCQNFSLALCKLYGYKIILWFSYSDDINSDVLIHAFNVIHYGDKTFYVDIRGITDNIADITNGYDYYDEPTMEAFSYEEAVEILGKFNIKHNISNELIKYVKENESMYVPLFS